MSKLSDLKKELRELRKKHCPPTGKMKKTDVEKELERLRGIEKHTEYEAPEPKPRAKKAKKETREMEVQTVDMPEVDEEEKREAMAKRMAELRARRKIAGAVTKAVEAKREKKATAEAESMAEKMARLRAMRKIGGAVKKAVEAKKEKKETEEKVEAMKKKIAGKKVTEAVKKMVETKKAKKAKEAEEEAKPKKRRLRVGAVAQAVEKIEEKTGRTSEIDNVINVLKNDPKIKESMKKVEQATKGIEFDAEDIEKLKAFGFTPRQATKPKVEKKVKKTMKVNL